MAAQRNPAAPLLNEEGEFELRGVVDLSAHPLAGKYRPPAYRFRRAQPLKSGDDYRRIWRMVDGSVRDALANHPEYLTAAGRNGARTSIVKRVTGALHSHAVQTARGRSGADTPVSAAITATTFTGGVMAMLAKAFARARRSTRRAEIHGAAA